MPGQFTNVNPAALSGQGTRFIQSGGSALVLAQNLHSRMASIGNCWGDDETGHAFMETYGSQSAQLEEGVNAVYEMLHGIGESLQSMAQAYQDADAAATSTANSVAS
jgi:uncharacterized protein YukE